MYGFLNHPGDSYTYSIYQQAGAAIRRNANTILRGLQPDRVLALGESQSAIRLVTYVDARFGHGRTVSTPAISSTAARP